MVHPGRITIGCVTGDADHAPCHLPGSGQIQMNMVWAGSAGLRNKKLSERLMKMWETQGTLPLPLRVQCQASGTKSGQGGASLTPTPHHFHPCISLRTCFLLFSRSIPAPNKGSPVALGKRGVPPAVPGKLVMSACPISAVQPCGQTNLLRDIPETMRPPLEASGCVPVTGTQIGTPCLPRRPRQGHGEWQRLVDQLLPMWSN